MAPAVRPGADRLATVINSIPAIALAPVLIVVFSREWTPVALAAVSVFFILYVATTSGLQHLSASHRDLFRAIGASRWSCLLRLDLPAALPAIISGAKFAVPAASIGLIHRASGSAFRGAGPVDCERDAELPNPSALERRFYRPVRASLRPFGTASVVEFFVDGRFRQR